MTREEAIEFIAQSVKSDVDVAKVADAIKALEQEPCEDAISRQAAIDAMVKIEQDDIEQYGCAIPEGFDSSPAIEALEGLQPITPQPETGHWIPVSERLPERVEWYLTSIKYDDGTERVTISWFDDMSFKAEIIAWMPLPEPYKESEVVENENCD